jgi:hypothetical protein
MIDLDIVAEQRAAIQTAGTIAPIQWRHDGCGRADGQVVTSPAVQGDTRGMRDQQPAAKVATG